MEYYNAVANMAEKYNNKLMQCLDNHYLIKDALANEENVRVRQRLEAWLSDVEYKIGVYKEGHRVFLEEKQKLEVASLDAVA